MTLGEPRTLGDRLLARDAAAFVGRAAELAAIERMRDGAGLARVAFVHGPAGVGKSTLLREAARRAARAGWTPVALEGRELLPDPGLLIAALAPAREADRPFVVLDTFERLASLSAVLRSTILPGLPAGAIVVIGSRRPPDAGWWRDGWEHVTTDVRIRELDRPHALELLARRGVEPDAAEEIAAWAGGSPLALALAAETSRDRPWSAAAGAEPPELVRRLVDRLVDEQADALRRRALETAAVARVTTPDLLADALAMEDATELYEWLAGTSIAEPLGGGITLHDLARRALSAELRSRDPVGERELRRRIVDHLYGRAIRGDLSLSLDLGEMAIDPVLRAGWVPDPDLDAYLDVVRPEDLDALTALTAERHVPQVGRELRALLQAAPQLGGIARNATGEVLGLYVATSATAAPEAAAADPVLGPWLDHARDSGWAAGAVLVRDVLDVTRASHEDGPPGPVQAFLNGAAFLAAGVPNPRCCYATVHPRLAAQRSFFAALGATPLPQLDVDTDEGRVETWLIDYGPDGFLAFQRADLYRQLGFEVPGERVDADAAVRAALRAWHHSERLAENPLAEGSGVRERAAGVRRRIAGALDRAFADTDEDRALRRVVELGYLDPAGRGHESAARELFLSRSHYFRRLRTAVQRLIEAVDA